MTTSRRHLIRHRGAELAAGFAAFAVGAVLLRDAYEGRGVDTPRILRPFFFW